jgi:hypothetical protein
MDRFVAKKMSYGWCIVDTRDDDEPLFGDNGPRDEREAKQCARAANIAGGLVADTLKDGLETLIAKALK